MILLYKIDLEEDISDWINAGNLRKLDNLVLTGYANLLSGRIHEVDDLDIRHFLDTLPQYQVNCSGNSCIELIIC